METLGLRPDQVDVLRTLPADQLVEALKTPDPLERKGAIIFWSVMDGGVLPRHPFYPDAPRESAPHPDDHRQHPRRDPRLPGRRSQELHGHLGGAARPAGSGAGARRRARVVVKRYRELYPNYTPSEVFFAATTAGRSWPGHLIQAEQRAKIGAPAWMYQLDFGSPIDGGKTGRLPQLRHRPGVRQRWTRRARRPARAGAPEGAPTR
jgi:para-nitrobenzyl esterase